MPGTSVSWPSVFVIDRSPVGLSSVVSVDVLLPGLGSNTPLGTPTVAVFRSVPVASSSMVVVTVNVALEFFGIPSRTLMLPAPIIGPLAPPA